jgi:glycosyltransferase involved in cell wall biosynthesis
MTILYFAPIDWDFIRQRPQHLAERLTNTFVFFYIQPLGLRNLRLSDIGRIVKRFTRLLKPRDSHSQGMLHIKNLIFIPIINRHIQRINLYILEKQLKPSTGDETIIWITTPSNLLPGLLARLKFKALVYEMLDDYDKIHTPMEKDIISTEQLLVNRADLIITTSSALFEKAKRINKNKEVVLIGNGVDYSFFNRDSFNRCVELEGMGKIVGYVGTIDDWLDLEAISFLAEKREDLDFVFVGPLKTDCLPQRKNIHFLGKRGYESIPHYCNSFDVCLIPFKPGKFADTINPVKLYEYFALGKPVVAYEMRELRAFNDLLYLAKDKEDFLEKLEMSLFEKDATIRLKRKEFAKLNDWSLKAKSIEDFLLKL